MLRRKSNIFVRIQCTETGVSHETNTVCVDGNLSAEWKDSNNMFQFKNIDDESISCYYTVQLFSHGFFGSKLLAQTNLEVTINDMEKTKVLIIRSTQNNYSTALLPVEIKQNTKNNLDAEDCKNP
eukprot:235300_1